MYPTVGKGERHLLRFCPSSSASSGETRNLSPHIAGVKLSKRARVIEVGHAVSQLRLVDAYPAVRFFAIAAGAKLELLGKLVLETANVGIGRRQIDGMRRMQSLLHCCLRKSEILIVIG